MSILLPQKWRQQPPYRTDIDWSNPLAKRLRLAQTSSAGLVDLVNQWPATKSTSDEIRGVNIPRLGSAVSFKGADVTNGGIDFGQVQASRNDQITVLLVANPTNAAPQVLFNQRVGSGVFNQFGFAANTGTLLATRTGGLAVYVFDVSANRLSTTSTATTFADGAFHVYAATVAGQNTTPAIYVDGQAISVSAGNTPASTWWSSTQKTRIGNLADYTTDAAYAASCDIPLCLVWDRALSAAEIQQISANPWQIFQPLRGIPVAFDAGGGAQTLTPSLYTNNQTFYSPTVTPGAVTLSPSLYTNQQTFYAPTLTATVTVNPSLYTNNQTFYGPTATPGTVTLQPALYTNTQSFYAPSVSQTGAVVYPSLFTNTNIFFAAEAINEYPDPSQVEFGVKYGPGGTLVGTLTGGGGSSIIRLRSFTERH